MLYFMRICRICRGRIRWKRDIINNIPYRNNQLLNERKGKRYKYIFIYVSIPLRIWIVLASPNSELSHMRILKQNNNTNNNKGEQIKRLDISIRGENLIISIALTYLLVTIIEGSVIQTNPKPSKLPYKVYPHILSFHCCPSEMSSIERRKRKND